ncbi:hypothetical protein CF319_g8688 [Tilletia indica]|nr:hypothetical protein CF319_g8688 [Tilletia indica]
MVDYFYGIKVNQSTISRLLKRLGYTKKNVTNIAIQQDEEERRRYGLLVAQLDPWQLIFADESSFNNGTAMRTRGWARRGEPAVERRLLLRGYRFSLLPAMSMDGIFAPYIIKGKVKSEHFFGWVKHHLVASGYCHT